MHEETVTNAELEKMWRESVAQGQASSQSLRAYAIAHGWLVHQLGYGTRRQAKTNAMPALIKESP